MQYVDRMSDFRGHGSWQQNNFWHTNQPQNQVDYGNNFKAQNFYDGNLGVQNFYNNQPSGSNRQVWLNEQQHLQPGNNPASHCKISKVDFALFYFDARIHG